MGLFVRSIVYYSTAADEKFRECPRLVLIDARLPDEAVWRGGRGHTEL